MKPRTAMQRATTVAGYLFKRLKQVGADHVFGVPGDFTLRALDRVYGAGVKFVTNCNELNAGYAADGYARTRGIGALFTTYGVGELSAINAVAGSFAEAVPVVNIVGLPRRELIKSGAIVHHTLGDGRNRVFEEIYKKVTCYQAFLDNPEDAAKQIDEAIEMAIYASKPTYIALPCDMVSKLINSTPTLNKPITDQSTMDPTGHKTIVKDLYKLLSEAKRPVLLVDRGMGVDNMRAEINRFARDSGIPTLTMPSGAGMIDHKLPNYYGVHSGPVGQFDTMPLIESADLLLEFGPMYSDTQTLGFSVVPKTPTKVTIAKNSIKILDKEYPEVESKEVLKTLRRYADNFRVRSPYEEAKALPDFRTFPIQKSLEDERDPKITQDKLYLRLNSYLRPRDIVLLANATPILGGRDFVLPDSSCRVIVSGLWFSIGHMLPAALGAALAQQRKHSNADSGRVVLFDGDGSFQVTAQELSTIIRHRLNVTIFIINNHGYAYERLIHNAEAEYHNIARWDYTHLPTAMGGGYAVNEAKDVGLDYDIQTIKLRTWSDVEYFLTCERFDNGYQGKGKKGLRMIDITVGRKDVPKKFKKVFKSAGEKLG